MEACSCRGSLWLSQACSSLITATNHCRAILPAGTASWARSWLRQKQWSLGRTYQRRTCFAWSSSSWMQSSHVHSSQCRRHILLATGVCDSFSPYQDRYGIPQSPSPEPPALAGVELWRDGYMALVKPPLLPFLHVWDQLHPGKWWEAILPLGRGPLNKQGLGEEGRDKFWMHVGHKEE